MTKEEILQSKLMNGKHSYGMPFKKSHIYEAMSEYSTQCTAPLEARIRELEEGLREMVNMCEEEKGKLMKEAAKSTETLALVSSENMVWGIVLKELQAILSSSSSDGWIKGVPKITEECVFVTMHKIKYEDREEKDYRIWEVKLIEGVNDKDEGCYYLALLDATDGVEWGTFDELAADMTYILPKPPNTI